MGVGITRTKNEKRHASVMTPGACRFLSGLTVTLVLDAWADEEEVTMDREEINALVGLTEKEMDAIGVEYEEDAWNASALGAPKSGRPSLYDAPMRSVTFKEAAPTVAAMDARAASLKVSRSDYIRKLIERDLAQAM